MDLLDAIAARSSVRNLTAVDIPEGDLERILDAGRRAPSGYNRQPIEFIVVRSKESLQALAAAQGAIGQVSLAIAVVGDPARSEFWLEDLSAAVQNMLLAITALGWASVWIEGTLLRNESEHKAVLGVPEGMRLMAILPIGATADPVPQKDKRPLSDMVHWERLGNRSR